MILESLKVCTSCGRPTEKKLCHECEAEAEQLVTDRWPWGVIVIVFVISAAIALLVLS